MRFSLKIFSIAGIPVRLHVSMLIIPLLAFGFDFGPVSPLLALAVGIVLSILLFGSVLLHELGHALMGRRFGVRTADIVLTPIGGIARMNQIPDAPVPEIAIAVAGPLVSLLIAFSAMAFEQVPLSIELLSLRYMAIVLSQLNLMLALFNLIPALPMDGGRILRGVLSFRFGFLKATIIATQIGRVLAIAGGMYGALNGMWNLVFIAVFVYFGAGQELKVALWRESRRSEMRHDGQPGPMRGGGFRVEVRRWPSPDASAWTETPQPSSAGVKVVEKARVEVVEK